MSILKYVNHNLRTSLVEMYSYLTNPEKTDASGLIGYGLNPSYAAEEMLFVQQLPHYEVSCHSKLYQHVIFSFDHGLQLPFGLIHQISDEIGWVLLPDERQMLGAIHFKNTANVHCHYMMNYISIDGKPYRQNHPLHYYKNRVNAVLQKYGLNDIVCYVPDYDEIAI